MSDDATRKAMTTARDVLLFRLEFGGSAPSDVVYAVHELDMALGLKLTAFKSMEGCDGD